jgi:hypothetical protein
MKKYVYTLAVAVIALMMVIPETSASPCLKRSCSVSTMS